MSGIKHFAILILTCIIAHGYALENVLTMKLNFSDDKDCAQQIIANVLEPFLLERLTFHADIFFQQEEFYYLSGLIEGHIVTPQQLAQAITHFQTKNKFSQVTLQLTPGQLGGVFLDVTFVGLWTFQKVTFEGLLRGKDDYQAYYLMVAGDAFDIEKHRHSLQKIRNSFIAQGYLNGEVLDYLSYDKSNKMVQATIVLDKKNRFVVGPVNVKIDSDDTLDKRFMNHLLSKVQKLCRARLEAKYYSHELLNSETKFIKKYLVQKGLIHTSIALDEQVNYTDGIVIFDFAIKVHQKKQFVFFGNHFFSTQELLEVIMTFGSTLGVLPESLLVQEVIDAYNAKGFWRAQVSVNKEEARCYFLINEGPRARVKSVELHCAPLVTNAVLKKLFADVLALNYYDEQALKQAINNLIGFYLQQGFWDVTILKQEYAPVEGALGLYKLVLTIDEGQRRFLEGVEVDSSAQLNTALPFAFSPSPGVDPVPFDNTLLIAQRQWLMDYCHKQGCLYATVKPEFVYNEENHNSMRLVWRISGLNSKVSFGKTVVVGNGTFPIENILRELDFKEGDVWHKDKLDKSLKNLKRLNIFKSIHLYPHDIVNPGETKSIVVKLQEDDPFEIRVRAGFAQVSKNLAFRAGSTYKVGGSVLYKNPFNVGDYVAFNADFTRFYRNIGLIYQRPWLFGYPINTSLKGYSNKYIQPVFIGSDKPLYQALQQGFLVGLVRQWDFVEVGITAGIEKMETNDLSVQMAEAINFTPELIDVKVPYIFVEPNIVVDYLDDQLNPTQGSFTLITAKTMLSWKEHRVDFFKLLIEQSLFFPIFTHVLAVRMRLGHIMNQTFSRIMPPERFYIGGQNTLRSYEPDFGPPLGSYIDGKGKRQFVPQGGKSMMNFNAEIRFAPIWHIGLVLFQDFGTLIEKSFSEIQGGTILAGTGFGLRYYSPIGPLRFDIGWKWRKQDPAESAYAWFLTLGHAF